MFKYKDGLDKIIDVGSPPPVKMDTPHRRISMVSPHTRKMSAVKSSLISPYVNAMASGD